MAVVIALLLVVLGGLGLGARPWYPEIVSVHGPGMQRMLDFTLLASAGFFVLGHLALVYLLVRAFRHPGKAGEHPRRQWMVALVPAVLMALVAEGGVIALGLPVFGQYYGAAPADALRVDLTGRLFFWASHYPGPDGVPGPTRPELITTENALGLDPAVPSSADDRVVLNELAVPLGRAARVTLHSTDVIHSFFVRELRVKQDAVPGMAIPIWFVPTKAGDYEIACNQICGLGHYRMKGTLHVLEPQAFEAWVNEQPPFLESASPRETP
jgi:cytochrome c oxidase subunit 2